MLDQLIRGHASGTNDILKMGVGAKGHPEEAFAEVWLCRPGLGGCWKE